MRAAAVLVEPVEEGLGSAGIQFFSRMGAVYII